MKHKAHDEPETRRRVRAEIFHVDSKCVVRQARKDVTTCYLSNEVLHIIPIEFHLVSLFDR